MFVLQVGLSAYQITDKPLKPFKMETKKLEQLIRDKGIKQTFIAKKLNVSRSLITYWIKKEGSVPDKYLPELKRIFS